MTQGMYFKHTSKYYVPQRRLERRAQKYKSAERAWGELQAAANSYSRRSGLKLSRRQGKVVQLSASRHGDHGTI